MNGTPPVRSMPYRLTNGVPFIGERRGFNMVRAYFFISGAPAFHAWPTRWPVA